MDAAEIEDRIAVLARADEDDIDIGEGALLLAALDRPGVGLARYRDHLDEWTANGWRLDWNAMRENEGDVAYVIPCPDRRNSGNWVLDEVPLKQVASESVESAA